MILSYSVITNIVDCLWMGKFSLRKLIEHSQAARKELVENIADATLGGIIYNLARLKELGLIRREGAEKKVIGW